MKWHKYSEEKPKPKEICLIKNYLWYGMDKPEYLLCEYSYSGEESSEPWTELNGEAETYGPKYSEYWISISEIEAEMENIELKPKYSCISCGRDAHNLLYYTKNNKTYCVLCVFDFVKEQMEKEKNATVENLTIKQAFEKYGFKQLDKEPS